MEKSRILGFFFFFFFGPVHFIFACTIVKYCAVALCRIGNKNFDPTKSTNSVSSRSKRLAGRKRHCDEQPQAKEVCPRKLDFEDSIETCVDFSADVTSVNHDHLYFCKKEQATPKK